MTQQPAPRAVRPRPNFRELEVLNVASITPHMKRVTIGGEGLAGFEPSGPATHFKMFFPQAGLERTVVPEWGPDGPVMPPGLERPQSRTYTPRRMDPTALELDIDFVMHGTGVGSDWVGNTKQGDYITIAGPGKSFFHIDMEADWYVIIGDDSALPAVGTILEALPAGGKAHVYSEVVEKADEQQLDSEAQVEFTWLHRGSVTAVPGKLLEQAVYKAEFPKEGRGCIYVACEAGIMRDMRKHFIGERGIDPTQVTTRGYWKQSAVNHPDNDYGVDA